MSNDRLLIVDDDQNFRGALVKAMTERGFSVSPAPNGSSALAWLAQNACDLMLLDLKLPDMGGLEVLQRVRELYPALEVILLTGHGTIDTAIEAIRMGAFDYLTKPCPADEVEITLQKAQERRELLERATILEEGLAPPDMGELFVGASPQYQELVRRIDRVARSDSSVLILGETGVGKELVAKLIHTRSPRSSRPFVVVDCGSFHEHLLQSELFGHEKGAYTGAARLKHGLFEVAHQGTIFLDEIGDVPPSLQVKLLRVLETGTFRRLGGTTEHKVDVRAVAATNRDLNAMVQQGRFREDLFYRLNAIRIDVPPLRERPRDVACLVGHFCERFNRRFEQERAFSPEALQALTGYSWPGNVRQLANIVEQSLLVADGQVVGPEALPPPLQPPVSTLPAWFYADIIPLAEVERQYVEFVVQRMDGHRAKAAKALGIGERSLYRRLKEYGIE